MLMAGCARCASGRSSTSRLLVGRRDAAVMEISVEVMFRVFLAASESALAAQFIIWTQDSNCKTLIVEDEAKSCNRGLPEGSRAPCASRAFARDPVYPVSSIPPSPVLRVQRKVSFNASETYIHRIISSNRGSTYEVSKRGISSC